MGANRFLYENKLNTSGITLNAVTASDENAEYPLENVYTNNYAQPFRSTAAGATDITLVFDFGSAVTIDAIGLGNVNLRSSATVKIQGHTADSWGAPDVDETIDASDLDGNRRCLYHDLSSSATKRYWRVVINDDGNPDGFVEVGEIFLGESVELNDSFDKTARQRLAQNNVQHETDYGQVYTYTRNQRWVFELTWTNAYSSTKDQILALARYVESNAKPFFFVIDDDPGDAGNPAEAYFVRMQSTFEQNRVNYDRFNLRANFLEELPGITVPK